MAQWLPWRKKNLAPTVLEPLRGDEPPATALRTGSDSAQNHLSVAPAAPVSTSASTQSSWRRGLSRLRHAFMAPFDRLLRGRPFSEEVFTELEEALLAADVGLPTTTDLIGRLRERCRREPPADADVLKTYLKEEMLVLWQKLPSPPLVGEARPWVILMVGVNGVGKTTTI
ncbi:MAG: signal recognition particle receptor subunit alpha, partial [Deltaproteobacteria bacterium]|nr:signal recognition particle receptor subunit alpha [Deltaproteobacteria bacterium]